MWKKVIPLMLVVAFVSTAAAIDLGGQKGIGLEPSKLSFRYWLGNLGLDAQLGITSLLNAMSLDLGFDVVIPIFLEKSMNFSFKPGVEITDLTHSARAIACPVGLEAEFFFTELPRLGFTVQASLATIAITPDFDVNIGIDSDHSGFGFHYYF